MAKLIIDNSEVVTSACESSRVVISTVDANIVEIEEYKGRGADPDAIDLGNAEILPGFIDIHNHGAVGVDVNSAGTEELLKVAEFLAQQGVTAWVPTIVPDSDESYLRIINAIDELMVKQHDQPVAHAVGVHYEGVFANDKMCGALRPEYFKNGQLGVRLHDESLGGRQSLSLTGLPMLSTGIHMTTLAPEIEGGISLIELLVGEGWIVSIGHTRADTETLERAFAAGARHLTHFFNAMTGIHHRDLGVAGWGLSNRAATFDIIADGVHVHPEILALACHAKSPANVSLISDSVAPTGLGDGTFELWGETVIVTNGRTKNERGSIAGSVSTLLDGVRTVRELGFSLANVVAMSSANPARLLGLENERGSIETGKRADLVGLNARGEIDFTIIGGELVRK